MTTEIVRGSIIAGKYRVERQIGSGGMGVVVEATHLALGQRVAVKLLDPKLAASRENLARFLREARVAATLPSEHIARVSDVGQTASGAPYLVMELLSGHDLAAELARVGRVGVSDAVDWILEACEGLADAHAAGLVHRDVKPENLFLAQRPRRSPILKILDFGLTKDVVREGMALTQPGTIFGTPRYMAPEQVLDSPSVDARCDQHALAMVLFEALTGRAPYEGTAASQLFVAIATAPPPSARALRPELPRALDEAITRALAKKPHERFPSLAELAEAIAPFGSARAVGLAANVRRVLGAAPAAPSAGRFAGHDPVASDADLTSSSDHGRRGRNKPWLAIAAGMGIAVLTGIAAVALVARYGSPELVATGQAPRPPARPVASSVTVASPVTMGGDPPTPPARPAPASPDPAPTVTPMETAAAIEGAASSTATAASAAAGPRGSARTAPANQVRKAIGVFGGERR